MKKVFRGILTLISIVLAVVLIATLFDGAAADKTEYYEFLQKLENNQLTDVTVKGNYQVAYKENDTKHTIFIPSRAIFASDISKMIEKNQGNTNFIVPTITYDNPDSINIWSTVLIIGGLGALVVVVFYMVRSMNSANKQSMNFGKTKARVLTETKVRFNDVAGAEEEKEELREIVDFLKSPKRFSEMGARIPRGVLLVGAPGTGKTLFAKAVAGEAGVHFFSISGSDFVEMFVGVGASRVRDLFEQAKNNTPCIIFIDEIDAVGRQRGTGLGGGHDEREQTLNQLLVQMDGFETNDGVIVMAATNRADILDPALLRPGRFDRQIIVHVPDVKGREAIFKVHSRNKPLDSDINYKTLARITSGFTGADISNLLNEAAILAVRANRKVITMADINEGIKKVIIGPQKRSRLVTESDKRITAYHEAGHALLAKLLKHCDPVHEVSIIQRGMAAGYTMSRPDNDNNHASKNMMLDNIAMTLGGRIAEEIVVKDVSTGASNDIQRCTALAHSMVAEYGMSDDIGTMYLGSDRDVFIGRDFTAQHKYSEMMAAKIDAETKKIIDSCYARAKQLIEQNLDILEKMARLLIERETIYTEEVDMLMEGKSVEEVEAYLDKKEADRQKNQRDSVIVEEKPQQVEQPTEQQQPAETDQTGSSQGQDQTDGKAEVQDNKDQTDGK